MHFYTHNGHYLKTPTGHFAGNQNCCCVTCTTVLTCQTATAEKTWCGFMGLLFDFVGCPDKRYLTGVRHDVVRDPDTGDTTCETTNTQTFDRGTCNETSVCVPAVGVDACDHCGYEIVPSPGLFPYNDTADSETHNLNDGGAFGFSEATLSDEYTYAQFLSDLDDAVAAASYAPADCVASKGGDTCSDSVVSPPVTITKLLFTIATPNLQNQCIQFDVVFTPAGGGDPTTTPRQEMTNAVGVYAEEIIPTSGDPDGSWTVTNVQCCPTI